MQISPPLPPLSALMLAGGEGRRMGGLDKGLVVHEGRPMLEHVMARLPVQVVDRVISCNRNIEQYAQYGRVVSDQGQHRLPHTYAGPMAGLLAGVPTCQQEWLLVMPCDMLRYPTGFADAAWTALQQHQHKNPHAARLVVAHDGVRRQNLCLLMHQSEWPHLQAAFAHSPAVRDWLDARHALALHWPNADDFINQNTLNTSA
jgi:molybdenum cofactor guanylyltransferase